jgi:hypothetical protein
MRTTKEQREVILLFAEDPDNFAVVEAIKQSAVNRPPTGGKLEHSAWQLR